MRNKILVFLIWAPMIIGIETLYAQKEPYSIIESKEYSILDSLVNIIENCHNNDIDYNGVDTFYIPPYQRIVKYENSQIRQVLSYENGILYREENFKCGLKNGYIKNYHNNGELSSMVLWKNDTIVYPRFRFYENGKISCIALQDSCDGYIEYRYYDTGELATISHYSKNYIEGITEVQYSKNGRLLGTNILEAGMQDFKVFYEDGNVLVSGKIINNPFAKIGPWKEWYQNGVLKIESYYNDSIPNLREGIWKYYDSSGELQKVETF